MQPPSRSHEPLVSCALIQLKEAHFYVDSVYSEVVQGVRPASIAQSLKSLAEHAARDLHLHE